MTREHLERAVIVLQLNIGEVRCSARAIALKEQTDCHLSPISDRNGYVPNLAGQLD